MLRELVVLLFAATAALGCGSPCDYGCEGCCRRERYPIVLPHCGPDTPLPPTLEAPPIFAPPQEGPLIHLPAPPAPAPRVISHKCMCTKTVVKPQVVRRIINVPQVTRYLKKSYKPVVEHIPYCAQPRCCESPSCCGRSGCCDAPSCYDGPGCCDGPCSCDSCLPPPPYFC